jgi:hypothetical protein
MTKESKIQDGGEAIRLCLVDAEKRLANMQVTIESVQHIVATVLADSKSAWARS